MTATLKKAIEQYKSNRNEENTNMLLDALEQSGETFGDIMPLIRGEKTAENQSEYKNLIKQINAQLQRIPTHAIGISDIEVVHIGTDYVRCHAKRFQKFQVAFTAALTKTGKVRKTSRSISFYER